MVVVVAFADTVVIAIVVADTCPVVVVVAFADTVVIAIVVFIAVTGAVACA